MVANVITAYEGGAASCRSRRAKSDDGYITESTLREGYAVLLYFMR